LICERASSMLFARPSDWVSAHSVTSDGGTPTALISRSVERARTTSGLSVRLQSEIRLLYVTSSGSTPRFCISPKISHGGAASAGVRNWWRCFECEYMLIIALKTRRS